MKLIYQVERVEVGIEPDKACMRDAFVRYWPSGLVDGRS